MRRFLLTLLALTGVVSALVVTGSSTIRQAYEAGMQRPVPLALVALLEVVNVAGTWTWLTDDRTHVRVEAAVGVALASLVTGLCGALTYGPLGLVAPAGLLAAVHLLSRMWTVPEPVPPEAGTGGTGTGVGDVADLTETLGAGVPSRHEEEPPRPGPNSPTGPGPVEEYARSAPDDEAGPDWSDDVDVLDDLQRRGEVDPTRRSLRTRYGMRHERAARLVSEHARRQADRRGEQAGTPAGTGVVR